MDFDIGDGLEFIGDAVCGLTGEVANRKNGGCGCFLLILLILIIGIIIYLAI